MNVRFGGTRTFRVPTEPVKSAQFDFSIYQLKDMAGLCDSVVGVNVLLCYCVLISYVVNHYAVKVVESL